MGNIEEKEKNIFEELREEVIKQSGEEHMIRAGQYDAVTEFSKFWARFDEQLDSLFDKHRTQVDEAIRSWIGVQIEERGRG